MTEQSETYPEIEYDKKTTRCSVCNFLIPVDTCNKEKLDFVYSTLLENVKEVEKLENFIAQLFSYHNPQYVVKMKTSLEYVSDLRKELVNNV